MQMSTSKGWHGGHLGEAPKEGPRHSTPKGTVGAQHVLVSTLNTNRNGQISFFIFILKFLKVAYFLSGFKSFCLELQRQRCNTAEHL